tara:strand:- start:14 stop:256 length:243 start_codon:yes stop_codon:yes gene_type:complete
MVEQVEDLIISQVHYLGLVVQVQIAQLALQVSHFKLVQVLVEVRVELVGLVEIGVKMVQTQEHLVQVDREEMRSLDLVTQ